MSKEISAQHVKELRDKTGAGMMEAKSALQEASGDVEAAIRVLRERGSLKAAKKGSRATSQGIVHAYIHGEGRIGVMLEVNSETDFVARNKEFKDFVHDLALHIAAENPQYVSREDVPADILESEKRVYTKEAEKEGKPAQIFEKIVAGKLEKFFQQTCLLEQPFVRDPDLAVRELLNQKIAKIGENIKVRRFVRYVLGED